MESGNTSSARVLLQHVGQGEGQAGGERRERRARAGGLRAGIRLRHVSVTRASAKHAGPRPEKSEIVNGLAAPARSLRSGRRRGAVVVTTKGRSWPTRRHRGRGEWDLRSHPAVNERLHAVLPSLRRRAADWLVERAERCGVAAHDGAGHCPLEEIRQIGRASCRERVCLAV